VEEVLLRLLSVLTHKPWPASVADLEDRMTRTFPPPIDKWAQTEAISHVAKGFKKSGLAVPADRVHRDVLRACVDESVALYLCAVLEYIASDILTVRTSHN